MIKTERLVIRAYSDQDQEDMIALLTNETIKKTFMIPDLQTREDAIMMFKKLQLNAKSRNHYEFGIYLKDHLIGFVNDVFFSEVKIELGYVIHPAYHKQGYATEVLQAVIKDLFHKGIQEIVTGAFATNSASLRVMEKCGMHRIAIEDDIFYRGETQHCVYYAIEHK